GPTAVQSQQCCKRANKAPESHDMHPRVVSFFSKSPRNLSHYRSHIVSPRRHPSGLGVASPCALPGAKHDDSARPPRISWARCVGNVHGCMKASCVRVSPAQAVTAGH
ncbi:hypothetical protein U9M48_032522, partial [Paspalum notatum var. saurae]